MGEVAFRSCSTHTHIPKRRSPYITVEKPHIFLISVFVYTCTSLLLPRPPQEVSWTGERTTTTGHTPVPHLPPPPPPVVAGQGAMSTTRANVSDPGPRAPVHTCAGPATSGPTTQLCPSPHDDHSSAGVVVLVKCVPHFLKDHRCTTGAPPHTSRGTSGLRQGAPHHSS